MCATRTSVVGGRKYRTVRARIGSGDLHVVSHCLDYPVVRGCPVVRDELERIAEREMPSVPIVLSPG